MYSNDRRNRLDSFNSDFDRQFDRTFKRTTNLAIGWFIFVGLLSVGILAVVAWAVVRVVLHFT